MLTRGLILILACVLVVQVRADGPADNKGDKVRPVPPPGIAITASQYAHLECSNPNPGKRMPVMRRPANKHPTNANADSIPNPTPSTFFPVLFIPAS